MRSFRWWTWCKIRRKWIWSEIKGWLIKNEAAKGENEACSKYNEPFCSGKIQMSYCAHLEFSHCGGSNGAQEDTK